MENMMENEWKTNVIKEVFMRERERERETINCGMTSKLPTSHTT
jgi:hypothetical protein